MTIKSELDDCPYLENPLPECYCRELSNQSIPRMVRYCLNRHRSCPLLTAAHTASRVEPARDVP